MQQQSLVRKSSWYSKLYIQVLIAVIIGICLGYFYPSFATHLKLFGDIFIKLIKMIVTPVIFCTIVLGIASIENIKKIGKTGLMSLLYFEIVSTCALIIGLIVVNVLKPGQHMNIDLVNLDTKSLENIVSSEQPFSMLNFFLDIVPQSFVGAFTHGSVLQVLFVSILCGFALHFQGGKNNIVYVTIEKFSHMIFFILKIIMYIAPLGALGSMAFTVGKYGFSSLTSLASFMFTFYLACFLFVFLILGVIAKIHKFSLWSLLKYLKQELLLVLGTSSSESALPLLIKKMETIGVEKSTAGIVIPMGYSFNLDGTSIYLAMSVIFIAQATNTPFTFSHQLIVLFVLLLTSKGAAGVTGSGFVVLAASLSSIGHIPVAGVALILGIDRFMSEARSLINFIGNAVGTIVIAKWSGELDIDKMCKNLSQKDAEIKIK